MFNSSILKEEVKRDLESQGDTVINKDVITIPGTTDVA